MKKKTLLAPSLFLSGILLFSGCGSSATTSAVHQNKSADRELRRQILLPGYASTKEVYG